MPRRATDRTLDHPSQGQHLIRATGLIALATLVTTTSVSSQGGVTPGVDTSAGWDYRMVAEVLVQLRRQSADAGDKELAGLLDSVRIEVPLNSIAADAPSAYAMPRDLEGQRWIKVEARWMSQVAGFADLGALFSLLAYGPPFSTFADNTFDRSCEHYQQSYRASGAQTYQFSFDDYLSRSDPRNAGDYLLLDKLSGVVLLNTVVWTVLHEVGHHALQHSLKPVSDNATKRTRELAADSFAFEQMERLGYSHFGVGSFMVARGMTDVCLGELGLILPEAQSTHPSWMTRDQQLRSTFDVTIAPWQETHLVYLPVPGDRPLLTTLVFGHAKARNRDVSIVQGDRRLAGLVEWRDTTATIYVRAANGGRLELILPNATRIPQLLVERSFDASGQFITSVKLPAVQLDAAALDFLTVGDQSFGSIRTTDPESLFTAHLKKAGGTPAEIVGVKAARDRYETARYAATEAFLKGRTQASAHSAAVTQASRTFEAEFIGILGRDRYQAFVTSYGAEFKHRTPPVNGINAWEQQLLEQNLSR